jgi:ABC-type sugar transport system permease subunit
MTKQLRRFADVLSSAVTWVVDGYFHIMDWIIKGTVSAFIGTGKLLSPVRRGWNKFVVGPLHKAYDKLVTVPPFRYVHERRKRRTIAQKRARTGYMYLLPWLIGFGGLVVYPFGRIIYMSFHNVFQYQTTYEYQWVGWNNYYRILREDIDFMIEVQNFIVRVLLYTPVIISLAIIIALLLNQSIKGKGIFRMIFFLPIIILNGELLENMSNYGGTDIQIGFFIIDVITTLVPPFAVNLFIEMFGYIVEILWYTGVPILIFLAMLQKIDRSLYEAASIDGANAWSIFWKITLPIIRPAITVSIIFIVVFLANFDGNPINGIILVSRSEGSRREGYASAMAIIYSFVQIAVITILYFIARERPQKGRV